jgi:hypothetical protein
MGSTRRRAEAAGLTAANDALEHILGRYAFGSAEGTPGKLAGVVQVRELITRTRRAPGSLELQLHEKYIMGRARY